MDVLQEYFQNKQVAIYNVPITPEDLQNLSFKDMIAHNRVPEGISRAMTVFEKISSVLEPIVGKTILDVGCHIGHFSFLMAEAGATVTGVESNPLLSIVAEHIKILKKSQAKIANMPIEEYIKLDNGFYDAVLLLNVFDQMLRENEEKAWNTLQQIHNKSKYVFMMIGPTEQLPNTPGLRTACPLSVSSNPVKQSWEYGYEMILRKGDFKEHRVLLRNSYAERELWLFY